MRKRNDFEIGDLVTVKADPYFDFAPDWANPESILLTVGDVAIVIAKKFEITPLVCISSSRGWGWTHPNMLTKL